MKKKKKLKKIKVKTHLTLLEKTLLKKSVKKYGIDVMTDYITNNNNLTFTEKQLCLNYIYEI